MHTGISECLSHPDHERSTAMVCSVLWYVTLLFATLEIHTQALHMKHEITFKNKILGPSKFASVPVLCA